MRTCIVTTLLGLSLAAYCVPGLAAGEMLRDRSADGRPTLLVVGTAHFHNPGRDLVNTEIDDVLGSARQAQILAVVRQLAAFRPTRVVLEWPVSEQAQLDSLYKAYAAGAQLGRTEKEQLGLRLAQLTGLEHVDAVDWNGRPPGPEDQYDWETYGNSHGQRNVVTAILDPSKLSVLNVAPATQFRFRSRGWPPLLFRHFHGG